MIESELGSINGWVYVDIDTSDVGGLRRRREGQGAADVQLPPGYWRRGFHLRRSAKQKLGSLATDQPGAPR
jgi:Cu/Ag efflux pump CusA